MPFTNPSDIARETLRRLASDRLPPTPENYRTIYHKIAETTPTDSDVGARSLAIELCKARNGTRPDETTLREFDLLLKRREWAALSDLTIRILSGPESPSRTQTREEESITALPAWLAKAISEATDGGDKGTPPLRLGDLIQTAKTADDFVSAVANLRNSRPAAQQGGEQLPREILEVGSFVIDGPLVSALGNTPLGTEARELADDLRGIASPSDAKEILGRLRKLAFRVELSAEDQRETLHGLVHLLRLVAENLGELVLDDRWVTGQIETLKDTLAKPIDARAIDSVERRLRDLIIRQSQLKSRLVEAQQALQTSLSGFLGQLTSISDDTSSYQERLRSFNEKLGQVANVVELGDIIKELAGETRRIQEKIRKTHDELQGARNHASAAQQRVKELEGELAKASDLVRHDHLTGALNRRGLGEVLEKEISRARRSESRLCIAVLDVDNFKQLNDSLGHHAGDEALVHLTCVIRDVLRPQDTVARTGGEEFLIVLPDTELGDAGNVMTRVQRELTKRFFLHDNQRILITFSAGVTELPPEESSEAAIKRADQLMYEAKRTGKNKVVVRNANESS